MLDDWPAHCRTNPERGTVGRLFGSVFGSDLGLLGQQHCLNLRRGDSFGSDSVYLGTGSLPTVDLDGEGLGYTVAQETDLGEPPGLFDLSDLFDLFGVFDLFDLFDLRYSVMEGEEELNTASRLDTNFRQVVCVVRLPPLSKGWCYHPRLTR